MVKYWWNIGEHIVKYWWDIGEILVGYCWNIVKNSEILVKYCEILVKYWRDIEKTAKYWLYLWNIEKNINIGEILAIYWWDIVRNGEILWNIIKNWRNTGEILVKYLWTIVKICEILAISCEKRWNIVRNPVAPKVYFFRSGIFTSIFQMWKNKILAMIIASSIF